MIFISKKKKIKIGKLIAATNFIATHSIGETDKKVQIESMSKIIENLASMAFEIGGTKFACVDIPATEKILQEAIKKRNEVDIHG